MSTSPRKRGEVKISVLAFGDEPRCGLQHGGAIAKDRHRAVGARQELADALLGTVDAELGHERGLAERSSGAGRLAERGRVAFDVEQVVGDLESFAERAAVI